MDTRNNMPGLSRRTFLAASAAGLGAAGLAASGIAAASASSGSGSHPATALTDAVLAAFRTHRVVGLGEETPHQLQEHHDALQTMLADPRLPGVVNDIVVEFGNALYQDTIDAFVLDGKPVADADLRPIWRNTTQSPGETWDAPVYEVLFRRVRAVNWTLPPSKRIRVLLGDPPFDWSKVTSLSQIPPSSVRDPHAASVVQQQVLAKGRRALLCYGGPHLLHTNHPTPSIVSLIQQQTGDRTYTIVDLVPLQGDPGGLATKLAGHARGTVIPASGTWLGSVNAGYALPGKSGQTSPYCGVLLGEILDAGLYLGQPAELTESWPNPAIYLDPTYWAELQRRSAIKGSGDLASYREEMPPGYPPIPAGAC